MAGKNVSVYPFTHQWVAVVKQDAAIQKCLAQGYEDLNRQPFCYWTVWNEADWLWFVCREGVIVSPQTPLVGFFFTLRMKRPEEEGEESKRRLRSKRKWTRKGSRKSTAQQWCWRRKKIPLVGMTTATSFTLLISVFLTFIDHCLDT